MASVPPPSGSEPLLRPELPDGLPPERIPPPPAAPSARDGLPAWPPWAPFAAMLVTLGIAILGAALATLVAQLAGYDVERGRPAARRDDHRHVLPGRRADPLGVAARAADRGGADGRAVRAAAGSRRCARSGGCSRAWVAFIAFSGIWAAALSIKENDDLPQELGADDSSTALFFVAVLVCVAAPIAEELFFRGFCFTALRRWIGAAGGAIATGVIFGLIHAGSADPVFLVPLGVFGALLCLLYLRTGSLLPCMVLHALNNSLALGVSQSWEPLKVIALMLGASVGGAGDRGAVRAPGAAPQAA